MVNQYKGTKKVGVTLDWHVCLGSGNGGTSSTDTTKSYCYCNPINSKCIYTSTPSSGWVKQTQITTSTGCTVYSNNNENGCFKKNNQYYWGDLGKSTGYTNIDSISIKKSCEDKNSGACYCNKEGTLCSWATKAPAPNYSVDTSKNINNCKGSANNAVGTN